MKRETEELLGGGHCWAQGWLDYGWAALSSLHSPGASLSCVIHTFSVELGGWYYPHFPGEQTESWRGGRVLNLRVFTVWLRFRLRFLVSIGVWQCFLLLSVPGKCTVNHRKMLGSGLLILSLHSFLFHGTAAHYNNIHWFAWNVF